MFRLALFLLVVLTLSTSAFYSPFGWRGYDYRAPVKLQEERIASSAGSQVGLLIDGSPMWGTCTVRKRG